jgi:hypothetical protein
MVNNCRRVRAIPHMHMMFSSMSEVPSKARAGEVRRNYGIGSACRCSCFLAEWYRVVPRRAGAAARNCYSESASLTDPLLFHVVERRGYAFLPDFSICAPHRRGQIEPRSSAFQNRGAHLTWINLVHFRPVCCRSEAFISTALVAQSESAAWSHCDCQSERDHNKGGR